MSLIPAAPRTIVKIADLLSPSHRRRGAIAVFVRHKTQWHRHDRRGSAVVPSLIAVAPRKTVNTADLRGVTAETLNMFKTSAGPPRVGPISVRSPRHRHYRRGTAMTAVAPYNQRPYRLRRSTICTSYGGVALQWRRLCCCVHEGAMARPWTGNGQFCSAINSYNRRKNVHSIVVLSFSRQIALHVVIVYLVVL